MMLYLYVLDAQTDEKIPANVAKVTTADLKATKDWQTVWLSKAADQMPNKVALHRTDNGELLGLMSYAVNSQNLAVEIIYMESARHSNANLLRQEGAQKRYLGIARALFAYAISISIDAGFSGVLVFKAKTTELLEYYIREFGARQIGSYDPFRLVIWEDAAIKIISDFLEEDSHG